MYTDILRALRIKKGDTQESIAEKIRVPKRTYASWERGERAIPYDSLVTIADMYEVSIDYLLGRENEVQQQSAITFPGTLKPADMTYDRPLNMLQVKADLGHAESAIQLENRYQMLQAIQSELQTLNDDRLKQALEYAQFLKKLEEK